MEELNLKIERYEGPLDLLLALIAKNKLNIFDIPIAEIAEQYMAHIEAMRGLNMEVTSEFIYYAAELMLIKSRMLLPREEEEDPRRNLVDALLEYRRARAAAELLRERGELYYDRFTKAPDEIEAAYERPHAVSLLAEAFERIRARLADKPEQGEVERFAKIGQERYYTVEEKSVAVLKRLCRRGRTPFLAMFDGCRSRGEAVAVFLAVLELVRYGRVDVEKTERDELLLILNRDRKERDALESD